LLFGNTTFRHYRSTTLFLLVHLLCFDMILVEL
jgi:hypothetical protein